MNVDASNTDPAEVELDLLIGLFFEKQAELGVFEEVTETQISAPSRQLLAHDHHMTVTVEKHHGCSVNVKVLETSVANDLYSRKILLTRTTDDVIVQFGIVRLNLSVLSPVVRQEIEGQQIPLGRVLINHDVLREVKLLKLYRIECGPALAEAIGSSVGQICFGRTALIYCDGAPAIELLEIVTNG